MEDVLENFFASVAPSKTSLWESRFPKMRREFWRKEDLPSGKEEQFREHLKKFDILGSMEPDGVLGKLVSFS